MESFCIMTSWTSTWINTIKLEKVYDICHDLSTFMDVRPCQNHDFRNSKFCWRQEGNLTSYRNKSIFRTLGKVSIKIYKKNWKIPTLGISPFQTIQKLNNSSDPLTPHISWNFPFFFCFQIFSETIPYGSSYYTKNIEYTQSWSVHPFINYKNFSFLSLTFS